jgi:superfamily II DNA/RNA helicase
MMVDNNAKEEFAEINNWDDLELNPFILRGIYSMGYESPSPIQKKACKPIIDGRDVIAQAQSGTGKTAAFVIAALSKIDTTKSVTQALILCPTRELANQISKVVNGIGSMMQNLQSYTLIGGKPIDEDIFHLRTTMPHIVTGCTGRTYDILRRKLISGKTIKIIILDEADEMLSTGFKDQVYNIFTYLNGDLLQVALFSASLPPTIDAITTKFMRNPVEIKVKKESLTLEGIAQYYIALEDDSHKYDTLKDLYESFTLSQCIIYCNSVKRVQDLYEAMKGDNFPVCCIHSEMTTELRDASFSEFVLGGARALISTDITSRGIDIQQLGIVINFDVPNCTHKYLHRIGRSGRWGRKGLGINFVTRRDIFKLKEIEQFYQTQIDEMPSKDVLKTF